MNGMPQKYMRRYRVARSITSGGALINSRMGRASVVPATSSISPLTTDTTATVPTDRFTALS